MESNSYKISSFMIGKFIVCIALLCGGFSFSVTTAFADVKSKPKKEGRCWDKSASGPVVQCYCHYKHRFNFFDYEHWSRWCKPCGTDFCDGKQLGGACRKEDDCTEH